MFAWLKKHFIPHPGNEHRPHILRDGNTRSVVIILLCIELVAFIMPSLGNVHLSGGMAAVLPAVLGDLTNEERQAEQLPVLAVNPLLTRAAEMKAADMAAKGYFAHTSPEGRTPWYWIDLAGYRYQYAGENLAVNFRDSKDVTNAWLNSPTHKANIVKGNYTEMGTGIARGTYEGRDTIFVAQVYANPLPEAPVAQAPVPRQPTPKKAAPETQIAKAPLAPVRDVLGAEASSPSISPALEVQPAQAAAQPAPVKATWWQRLLASPRNTTNILVSAVFAVIALALVLYTVLKIREHDLNLVTNGLAVLAVAGAILVANYYVSVGTMTVTQSVDYSLENTI